MKADQLRKAILQMAIQGKLVPQDPNDESASVLLEKICAEKQKLIKEGKIKKDKVNSVIFRGEDNRHYEKVGNEVRDITDEIDFELPDGWEICRLNSISYISAGGTPERNNPNYWEHGNIPWLKISDITSSNKYVNNSTEFITQAGVDNSSAKIMHKGTILYTIFATIGEVGILNFESSCNQAIAGVMPYNVSITEYLYYYLVNLQDFMKSISKGCAQFNINQKILRSALVPLPPLAEQERIVVEIEKYEPLIAEYDKLEQQKSKLDGEIYDKLKKSILQYAIQGKLVPQEENDEPASELLKRIRAEKKAQLGKKYVDSYIYKGDDNCYYEHIDGKAIDESIEVPFDLPDNWSWCKLGDITFVTKLAGFEYTEYIASNLQQNGVPLFKGKNIQNSKIIYEFESYVSEQVSDMLVRSQITKKCILTPYVGSIGNIGIHDKVGKYHLGSNVGKIELSYSNVTTEEFIVFYLKSTFGYAELTKHKKATAQESISIEAIRDVIIPIPPLAEQRRIVNKLNEIFAKL